MQIFCSSTASRVMGCSLCPLALFSQAQSQILSCKTTVGQKGHKGDIGLPGMHGRKGDKGTEILQNKMIDCVNGINFNETNAKTTKL